MQPCVPLSSSCSVLKQFCRPIFCPRAVNSAQGHLLSCFDRAARYDYTRMKQDILTVALKVLGIGTAIAVILLWGMYGVLVIAAGVLVIWFSLCCWSLVAAIKRDIEYTRPMRAFQHAIQKQQEPEFEKLLHRHLPAWKRSERLLLCQDVFEALIRADSLLLMQSLLLRAEASWWQEQLSHADLLCSAVLCGSPDMLRLLLEEGMKPTLEWESPWLITLINARIDHARVLASLRADVITPEQQERSAWPPLADILNTPDFFPNPEHRAAVLDYLKECQPGFYNQSISGASKK